MKKKIRQMKAIANQAMTHHQLCVKNQK